MKIEIENYRGHQIFYDDDREKFVCEMVIEDNYRDSARGELKAMRQEIDKFIKANSDFKPFKVMSFEWGYDAVDKKRFDGNVDVRTAVGVRKDGCLIVEREGGRKEYYNLLERHVKSLRKYNSELFAIAEEWKKHEAIWEEKKKELQEKAKPFIETIDIKELEKFRQP